eukprot:551946-Prorocentrum_minimum.AAC.1
MQERVQSVEALLSATRSERAAEAKLADELRAKVANLERQLASAKAAAGRRSGGGRGKGKAEGGGGPDGGAEGAQGGGGDEESTVLNVLMECTVLYCDGFHPNKGVASEAA